MNEQDIKKMVESILTDLVDQQGNTAVATKNVTEAANDKVSENVDENCSIADITEVDLKKQLLVTESNDADGYLKMKSFTPARIGVGRAGQRYMTQSVLRFRADHAAAQDAVFSDVSEELIKELNLFPTQTICQSKDEYLTRPDYGRVFDETNCELIKDKCQKGAKLQIVVGDGLSSAAIEANVKEILPSIKQGLKMHDLDFDQVLFVKYCRVPAMDKIAELTEAEVVCLLVGERPGLVTAESMSAYIAYRPTVGMPEARRTVISNIHKGGTTAVEAGAYIAELNHKMLQKKKSGIDLKEAE